MYEVYSKSNPRTRNSYIIFYDLYCIIRCSYWKRPTFVQKMGSDRYYVAGLVYYRPKV